MSASYDQTIRLWDPRIPNASVLSFTHSGPVETILPSPSGTTLFAAASNSIAVLDIVAGKPLTLLRNHQKTVTSLSLGSNGSRLVSGGLDGHVKIFETTGYNVVAGLKYSSPILSLAVLQAGPADGREDRHIVVGMSDGTLSVKTRSSGEAKIRERAREREMQALLAGTIEEHDRKLSKLASKKGKGWEKRFRGRDYDGKDADIVIDGNVRSKSEKKLKTWDRAMHTQKLPLALDLALASGQRPVVLAVLTELRYRGALRVALENRDEKSLQPVLYWVVRNLNTTQYTDICVELGMHVMDLYAKHVGASELIDKLMIKLQKNTQEEVYRSQQAIQTKGMLELLVPEIGG